MATSSSWLGSLKQTVLQDNDRPPWLLRYRSNASFISATVSMAVFTDIFLYAVIVPVMPYTLTEKTGIDPDAVQHWNSILIAVYGAALLAFSPICGWFADHTMTRRLPLLLGLLALAGSTIMLNVGSSIAVLVGGRLLQGASAAVVWVVGLALLVDTVGQGDVGRAMGWVSTAMSLAVMLAPLLGGVVLEHGGYDAVFAMAYALIGVDVALRLVLVEKKVARRWEGEGEGTGLRGDGGGDGAGEEKGAGYGATATAAGPIMTTTTPPREEHCCCGGGNDDGEKEGGEKKSVAISPVSDPSAQEDPEKQQQQQTTRPCTHHSQPTTTAAQRSPSSSSSSYKSRHRPRLRDRLPPTLSLLLSRRLAASLWSTLVVSILMSSLDAVVPLYVRQTFHWSSTGAGLVFLPVFGALADRGSPRWPAAAGFLACCPCWTLLRLVTDATLRRKALLCALLALLGLALTAIMPCVMAEITHVVAAKERRRPGLFGRKGAYAQAYGLFNMAWAGGALVGPIWSGYVEEGAGWGTMGWSLGLLAAVSAVPAVLWTGGWVFGKKGPVGGGRDEERA